MTINYIEIRGGEKKLKKDSRKKRVLKIGLLSLLGLILFLSLSFLIFYPQTALAIDSLKEAIKHAKRVEESIKKQDVIGLRENSLALREKVAETKEAIRFYGFIGFIPFVGDYYRDLNRVLNVGTHSSESAIVISESLVPFADSLGLKGTSAGNTQERVSKIVQIMPKILPKVDVLEEKLQAIKKEISPINPNRYPEEFRGVKIRIFLSQLKDYVSKIEAITPELKPILSILPSALGDPDPKGYLLLLQNDGELRSTGGFITSVAYVRVVKGQIVDIKSEDVYKIDDRIKSQITPPEHLAKYLKVDKFHLRDTNTSADFTKSMEQFRELYALDPKKVAYDGFIALDTEFVRKLIEITGPITTDIYKETFSSELQENGVPDVIYKLELYSQKLLVEKEERKELLGDLLNSLLKTVLNAPSDKLSPLMEAAITTSNEKHLLMYSFDPKTQDLLDRYNMSGKIRNYEGDYLHINQNNYGGLKANLFIKEIVEQDIKIEDSGEVVKTVRLHLNNTYKEDGWLNGRYNDYVRFLVPSGSSLISAENDPKEGFPSGWSHSTKIETGSDLDKTVFNTFTALMPQSATTVSVTYKLPFKVKKGQDYKMLVQKQPGIKELVMMIRINGREVENSKLRTDKELKFKI